VFVTGDSSIVGVRLGDTDRGTLSSLNFNLRFPLTRNWRLNPRLRFDRRSNINTDGNPTTDQDVIAYALRVDYRLKRNLNFEFDIGQEQTDTRDTSGANTADGERRALFLSLGYRYDF